MGRHPGAGGGGAVSGDCGRSCHKMDEVEMARPMCVFQCGNRITEHTSTKEHIVPNAIGGRKKVTGFICNNCNSRTGAIWDAELARQLNPLSLLLGIRRQRGEVPSQVFPTAGGSEVRLLSDGRRTIAKPSHEITTDGDNTRITIHARTMQELRGLMNGMRRKYPSLGDISLEDLMATAKVGAHYNPEWTKFDLEIGGAKAGRSLVKSAVALAYDAGIDPNGCDLALDYLLNEEAEPCFGYYYDKDRDFVINRPVGKPFHCVYVKGSPDSGTILGYVELFSLYRLVLCLSSSYLGRAFTNTYAIDPVKGEEIDLDVNLDLSILEIRSAYDYKKYDSGVVKAAASSLFEVIVAADFDRALVRNIKEAVANAFAKSEAGQGEFLTDAQCNQLIRDIVDHLTPFIEHNAARLGCVSTLGETESST